MLKYYLMLIGWSLCIEWVQAQEGINKNKAGISILGKLLDAGSKSPVEYATITLQERVSKKIVNGGVTDEKGFFKIDHVIPGDYAMILDVLTYPPDTLIVSIDNNTVVNKDIGTIMMSSQSFDLNTVTITARQSLIENKVDKLVYNVDKDISSQGGMATDALRKIPQVTVDINGNVELLGNPSVRFLIDGKPSAIFGASIADALQSIPASQIQSIEVISSPGAKYDATGTGGVINIILKKNKTEGFSGTTNVTIGTRQENAALNLNYKRNNVAITGYFSGSAQLKSNTINEIQRHSIDRANSNTFDLNQTGTSEFNRNGYRSGVSLDWDMSAKDNLSCTLSHYHFGNNSMGIANQTNIEKTFAGFILLDQRSIRNAENRFNNYTYEAGIDYRRKLKREKQEFTLSYHLSIGENSTAYRSNSRYPSNNAIFQGSQSSNPGKDYVHTLALDYAEPLTKNLLLEAGTKAELESLISNSEVFTFSPLLAKNSFDPTQSYTSNFDRQVYAGYLSGNFSLSDHTHIIAGVRWEHTINQTKYSKENVTIPDYNNLGPALTIAHSFKDQKSIKFSYAYRLERPEYRDLNPFVNLADPHNINTGNPLIRPEIGNDFQLGYNQPYGKDNNLNIVLVYTYNSPDIKSYTIFYPSYKIGDSLYSDVNVTRRDNIAAETRWGANLSTTVNAIKNMSIRTNIQLYNRTTRDHRTAVVTVNGFEYRGNININYHFPHELIAEAFGNYNSGIRWQGIRPPFYSYTLAMRKQISKGIGSIGITAVNAFGKYLNQESTQVGEGFMGSTLLRIPYRSFGISFNYKFGKIKISKPKEGEDYLTKPPVDN